jgi:hypothetical protein
MRRTRRNPYRLFLDSLLDPRCAVTIAYCCLRDHISIHKCFEAIQKYESIIARGVVTKGTQLHARCASKYSAKPPGDNANSSTQGLHNGTPQKPKVHTGYRTYKEWIKLTPEQHKEILQQHSTLH